MNTGWTQSVIEESMLSICVYSLVHMLSLLCPSCWPPNGYNLSCVITSLLLLTVCSAQQSEQCTGWLDGVLQQSSNVIMANIDRN